GVGLLPAVDRGAPGGAGGVELRRRVAALEGGARRVDRDLERGRVRGEARVGRRQHRAAEVLEQRPPLGIDDRGVGAAGAVGPAAGEGEGGGGEYQGEGETRGRRGGAGEARGRR